MARLRYDEVMKYLVECYSNSLDDDSGFTQAELVEQLGADENEVTYDEENDEFIVSDRVEKLFQDETRPS